MRAIPKLILLGLFFVGSVNADEVRFRYSASLSQSIGTLSAGSSISGTFSYESVQIPFDFGAASLRRYELTSLSLLAGSSHFQFSTDPGKSHIWAVVGDGIGQSEDFFTVRSEFSGSELPKIGGVAIRGFFLFWNDSNGVAGDGFKIPISDKDFDSYTSAKFWFEPNEFSLGDSEGVVISVSQIPIPGCGLIFVMSAFISLGGRKKVRSAIAI